MDQNALAELIKRYRAGIATEKDKYLLEKIWNDALEDTSFLESLSDEDRNMLKAKMFAETRLRISQLTASEPSKTRTLRPWVYRVAAAVALLAAVSFIIYWNAYRMTEIHTGFGERLAITLPDRSQITLNGNSTLRYNRAWSNDHDREVWIDGEGFFAVQHTQNHQKFIVHTSGQLNVEVLGTKFNIKSREEKSEVMLTEGKVKLDMPDTKAEPVFLKPGELATMADKKLSKRVVRQKQYTSWLNYTLIFERTTLRDVAALLKDTYGLDVIFTEDALQTRELSGEISSAHAEDILFAIAQTFNLKVDRDGQAVTISSK
jgi:transmembrane sensor